MHATTTTALQTVLSEVFSQGRTVPPVSLAEETALIAEARLGASSATADLIRLYAPALRSEVRRHRNLDAEEAQAVAVAALTEAIMAAEPGARLAATISLRLRSALTDAASQVTGSGFTVPSRTVKRFLSFLRQAEGDVYAAATIAERSEMRRETFFAVLDAVRKVDSLEGETERRQAPTALGGASVGFDWHTRGIDATPIYAPQQIADAEDRALAALAFSAVDEVEAEVCRLAYGFADFDPVPDAEIAHRLGYSRPKVQRIRTRALDKMRAALGA